MKPGTRQGHKDVMRSLSGAYSTPSTGNCCAPPCTRRWTRERTLGGGSVVQRGQLRPRRWLFGQVAPRTPNSQHPTDETPRLTQRGAAYFGATRRTGPSGITTGGESARWRTSRKGAAWRGT